MTSYLNPSTRSGGVEHIVVPERATAIPVEDAPFDDSQYVRINGEWVPYNAPPIVPDTLAPSPPTSLSSAGTISSGGNAVNYTLTWVAPTTNADTTALTDFAYYVVRWRYGITGPWTTFVSNDPTALLPGLTLAVNIEWAVLARDISGNDSTWATGTITGLADTAGPAQPSIPVLSSRLGTITATWNGLDNVGAPQPADFKRLEFYMSATTGGPWTYVDQVSGAGATLVTSIAVGAIRYVTTVAFDTSGNASVRSAEASITVVGITGPDIAAGAITANELAAGAVTALKLSATAIDGKTITGALIRTSPSGSRVEMTVDGIRLYDATNAVIVDIPTDPGAPVHVEGEILAHALTVEDNMHVRGVNNELATGSVMTMASSVTAPAAAPSIVVDYPSVALTAAHPSYTLAQGGGFADASGYWVPEVRNDLTPNHVLQCYSVAGAPGARIPLGTAYDFVPIGATKVGTDYYAVVNANYATNWKIEHYSSTGALLGTFDPGFPMTPAGMTYFNNSAPAIGTDGTNLFVAACNATQVVIKTFSTAGALLATYTAAQVLKHGLVAVMTGTFDYGSTRWLIADGENNQVYVYTLAGSTLTLTNETFNSPPGSVMTALFYTSSTFQIIDLGSYARGGYYTNTPRIYFLTANKWTTADSAVWWASYAWHQIAAGFKTVQGPKVSFTMALRARLTITAASIPGGTTPPTDSVKFYVGRGAADPGTAGMWDGGVTTGAGVRVITAIPLFSGTNPLTVGTFTAGVAAILKSSALRPGGVTPKWSVSGTDVSIESSQEIVGRNVAGAQGQFRAIGGTFPNEYGFMLRNDGANTYFLFTAVGDPYGSWAGTYPMYFNNATKAVTFGGTIAAPNLATTIQDAGVTGAVRTTAGNSGVTLASTITAVAWARVVHIGWGGITTAQVGTVNFQCWVNGANVRQARTATTNNGVSGTYSMILAANTSMTFQLIGNAATSYTIPADGTHVYIQAVITPA